MSDLYGEQYLSEEQEDFIDALFEHEEEEKEKESNDLMPG
jgi:hypothetical protein